MRPFKLERYFGKYEFTAKYLLSPSDCESLSTADLLGHADEESLELWQNLMLGYTEPEGHPLLRKEIAGLYETMSADDVIVAMPEECIYIAMTMMLRKSEQIICPLPAYQSLYEIAGSSGCKVLHWPLEDQGEHWYLDPQFLRDNISRRTRMIVINFPHNPTGHLCSLEDFDAIMTIARENELFVFCDEMYRFLEHDPQKRLPSACDIYDNAVCLGGLSKSYSLPGLRIGWLATKHRALLRNFLGFKDYTSICNSAPSEILGIMALRQRQRIFEINQERVSRNLAHARDYFTSNQELFGWMEPEGGSTAFIKWKGSEPIEELCENIVAQENVMVVPGTMFDVDEPYFRVGLGRENFPEALAAFDRYFSG